MGRKRYFFLTHPEKKQGEQSMHLTVEAMRLLAKRSTEDRQLIDLLKGLKPGVIGVGTGIRFCQTYEYLLQHLFPDVPVVYSDSFGTDISRIVENGKVWVVFSDGTKHPEKDVIVEGESPWPFLTKIENMFPHLIDKNKIFVFGNRYLERHGVEGHSLSLFEKCPHINDDWRCLMKQGKIL